MVCLWRTLGKEAIIKYGTPRGTARLNVQQSHNNMTSLTSFNVNIFVLLSSVFCGLGLKFLNFSYLQCLGKEKKIRLFLMAVEIPGAVHR